MRLSELMSNMDLAFFPQVALVIFLAVFVGVVYRLFSKRYASEYERAAQLPFGTEGTDNG